MRSSALQRLTESLARLKSQSDHTVAHILAAKRLRMTLSPVLSTSLGVAVVAGMLWAVPHPVARASSDDANEPTLTTAPLGELPPELEAAARRMQHRMRTVKHIVGASSDWGDLDLALVFAEEYTNPTFSIEPGVQQAQVMGKDVIVDVLKVEDGRLHLEQALNDPSMAPYHDDFEQVLSTHSSIHVIDFIATGQSGGQFSSRTVRWTGPQWERPDCLALTSPDAPMCGVSIPFDVILPRDYYDIFPTAHPLVPPSWSFKDFVLVVRDPNRLDEVIEERAHQFPELCVLCPNGTVGFCWSEFLKGNSEAGLAKAAYDLCMERACDDFQSDIVWEGVALMVVLKLCLNIEIDLTLPNPKVKFPKHVKYPKTWPSIIACALGLGIPAYFLYRDYKEWLAAEAVCLWTFRVKMEELFDEVCAAGGGTP